MTKKKKRPLRAARAAAKKKVVKAKPVHKKDPAEQIAEAIVEGFQIVAAAIDDLAAIVDAAYEPEVTNGVKGGVDGTLPEGPGVDHVEEDEHEDDVGES